jgi:hypothetical protein
LGKNRNVFSSGVEARPRRTPYVRAEALTP